MTKFSAADLFAAMIKDQKTPVFTNFELYLLARKLFRDRSYRGVNIPHRNGPLTASRTRELMRRIAEHRSNYHFTLGNRLLVQAPDFSSELYLLNRNATAAQQLMAADPICYLSHRSALEQHGLCPANPTVIHITTPRGATWRQKIFAHMTARLTAMGEMEWGVSGFEITKARPDPIIAGVEVHQHETRYLVADDPDVIDDCRVAPIGITFRDTLIEPQWCGGIAAVIDIWQSHAAVHLEAILPAIDAAPTQIAKVRAGYILDTLVGIADPRIEQWTAFAQRGSSRRLDPSAPFASKFSEKWMLSLNVNAG